MNFTMIITWLTFQLFVTQVDHQAILKMSQNFATQLRCHNASKMADCCSFVCTIERAEIDSPFFAPSHEWFAKRYSEYILTYLSTARILADKYELQMLIPFELRDEKELFNWLDSIKRCTQMRYTMINGFRCLELRLIYCGKTLMQRFVQAKGQWLLGSPPFLDVTMWDTTRNHPAIYGISAVALEQVPQYLKQAQTMAKEDEAKEKVTAFLLRCYLINEPSQESNSKEQTLDLQKAREEWKKFWLEEPVNLKQKRQNGPFTNLPLPPQPSKR